MLFRDLHAADAGAPEAVALHDPAGVIARRILEHRAAGRIFQGLSLLPPVLEIGHRGQYIFFIAGDQFQADGGDDGVQLEQTTVAVGEIDLVS